MKRIFMILISSLMGSTLFAQRTVTGVVKDTRGNGVEYATVFTDSAVTLTDLKGHFKLEIPNEDTSRMTIRHISFQPKYIPNAEYMSGNQEIIMQDAVNELAEVTISVDKNNKRKAASGIGMKMGFDAILAQGDRFCEFGPSVKPSHDIAVEEIIVSVSECTLSKGIIRIVIYEMAGDSLFPQMAKPLYSDVSQCGKMKITLAPPQPVLLQKGHLYFAGLSLVDSSQDGHLAIPDYMHPGYILWNRDGIIQKFPFCMGIRLLGKYQ